MKNIFISFILLPFFLVCCKKNETEPPVVTIFSPATNDSFYVMDSVKVNFTVSDKNLSVYKIIIFNYFTRKILFKEETAVTSNNVTLEKQIFIDTDADTSAYINVLGIDKNGNTGSAGVLFKLKK